MPSLFTYKDNGGSGLLITGMAGSRARIAIPREIGGLPVTGIAPRSLADRPETEEISLPDTIREIGSYAFYNCRNLTRLSLFDSVEDLSDGVIRMCPSLFEISVSMRHGRFRLVKDLIGDSDAELLLRLTMDDGEACLTFPGYYSEVREDTRARAIHQSIVGAGYSYRQCVTRAGIDYGQYDGCFARISAADPVSAGIIALRRLMYPYRLTDEARGRYTDHLRQYAGGLLPELIEAGDAGAVRCLTETAEVPPDVLDSCLREASAGRKAEICGILMDAAGKVGGGSRGPEVFSLDDL